MRARGAWTEGTRVAAIRAGCALLLAGCAPGTRLPDVVPPAPATPNVEFAGGFWYTGRGFIQRTVWIVDGRLDFRRPPRVDSVIDVSGRFVVPPFGEAHNHNVEYSPRIAEVVARYLSAGVFYVRNPDILPRARAPLTGIVNVPTGPDVIFANGGITGPYGHPIAHYRRNLARGVWGVADGEGAFYHTVATADDIERLWPRLLAAQPDFIKTFLLYSEDYRRRHRDSTFLGRTGLDPALLIEIVRRAHRTGLRVTTHVETAADFRAALLAGVDEIAHMPGFRGDEAEQLPNLDVFLIRADDARRAATQGTVVVTTLSGAAAIDPLGPDSLLRRRFDRLHTANLRVLRDAGVNVVVGSDAYDDVSTVEIAYLRSLKVYDDASLLHMWSVATPRSMFPQRSLGRLEQGSDASFLVLDGNPIADFTSVSRIRLRVKGGRIL